MTTGILQGFMTPGQVRRINQRRVSWLKRPRRGGTRTRPGPKCMCRLHARQHKSAVSDACKAARPTCKENGVPPARIRPNPRTAATPATAPLPLLGVLSHNTNTNRRIQHVNARRFQSQIAVFCKACRIQTDSDLQGQSARSTCKATRRPA